METSVDWSSEVVQSLFWILKAFAITAPIFLIVVALLLRFTKWGRDFWNVAGPYFSSRDSWKVYALLGILLFSTLFGVRMSVLFSYWSNDQYTSMQFGAQAFAAGDAAALEGAKSAFWNAVVVFAVLATIHVVRVLVDFWLGQWFDIRWRVWLTERVATDWLDGQAYYRGRFISEPIDNPDQRIQQDTLDFVQTSRTLSFGAVSAIVTVVSFTKILWDLSGPVNMFGWTMPRAMMFLVIIYVLVTTVVAFWIGNPLIKLNFLNERLNANFRYALVRLRDSAENVAFYRGEGVERNGLFTRFAKVIKNYWHIVFRTLKFQGWNLTVNQTAELFPLILQGPRLFAGEITFGDISQTSRAFGAVHDSLSFFREAYDDFAAYRASLIRLNGLLVANSKSRDLPKITMTELDDALEADNIDVRKPDGEVLIDNLNLRLTAGDALVVKGASGSGKTTLLRTLAQMWPFGDGSIKRPDSVETLFLSQIPYLPLGDLRTTIAYPAKPEDISDEVLRATLDKVSLGHIANRLDEEEDWAKILSPGEQQRVAFARILLIKPKLVFLDEATSAVDEGLEYALYKLVREEVPELILVSVAHRSTVDQHHTQMLELEGDGPWRLSPVTVDK
ncbi:ABC transporter ATP-binding protein/permease [Antrihabitans sp. YC3-6]|uniref:ABC transporter ATP-binding protein/permease n=1 Tax=Antrihabitans stalagmiti TaxID=2799499 RepID=A0A934U5L4_9NOCA|nr:ABC transporter ATP-binding protein/permease [Antrihabitans stalagmiti]MBJ8341654.1 ABC transporter ATP-binding protein/permease [Antrihabitans stalagmiti]